MINFPWYGIQVLSNSQHCTSSPPFLKSLGSLFPPLQPLVIVQTFCFLTLKLSRVLLQSSRLPCVTSSPSSHQWSPVTRRRACTMCQMLNDLPDIGFNFWHRASVQRWHSIVSVWFLPALIGSHCSVKVGGVKEPNSRHVILKKKKETRMCFFTLRSHVPRCGDLTSSSRCSSPRLPASS